MPPKKGSSTPELLEPYERHSYADLRHELAVRHIRLPRSSTRVGFIRLLRDWDSTRSGPKTPRPTKRTPPRRTQSSTKNQNQMSSTRVIRARRGCRFRLINVLLSPDFNGRWAEMVTRGGKMEVNRLWMDVHAAFMAQNSMLDTLHFQDALFVNVTPNVILSHSAARLLQMWIEIVAMYRNAVAQAKVAAAHNDNAHSFFDFCAGRLDLLYLHMAMLLESKLYEFIMSDKLQAAESVNRSKPSVVLSAASAPTAAANTKAVGKTKAAPSSSKPGVMTKVSTVSKPTEKAIADPAPRKPESTVKAAGRAKADSASSKPELTSKAKGSANAPETTMTRGIYAKTSGLPTQNPEMQEPANSKCTETTPAPKITTVKGNKAVAKAKQVKPVSSPNKSAGQKKPQKAGGKGKATSTASAKEAKPKASPSKQKQTVSSNPKAATSQQKSSMGDKPAQTTSLGKRPREEVDAAIVEIPTVSDIVPHSGKRIHTTTTTISTALATRPADVMLPPDEWDILESRLRKVNENIDRCHRGLASVEGNVSDSYKQSLEADLRFYSAIKQRLQEQLLVVMQSGY
ncbi:Hypothetical protein PHPALM_9 [Phytophthora palmivora]|uniref:Uncharacterized protein n=1 Tax=Phytophthora palmivora TaxID=4796 RepID=A0A2P4YVX0_9STRA|nr:Hypothetical protein PHPALM_9 [Phytophthora palmivora]